MEESLAARDLEEQRLAGAEPPAKRRRLEGGFGGSPAWAWARSLMFWRPSRKSLEPPPWPSRGRAAHGLFAKSMARPPWHAEGAPGAAEPTEEAIITTINRIAIITNINRIAIITTINNIAIITTINRGGRGGGGREPVLEEGDFRASQGHPAADKWGQH